MANSLGGTVTVIDGATNTTLGVTVGANPVALAINTVTNKIYVANQAGSSVSIIDGTNNSIATIPVGSMPVAIAINTITNKIYVANSGSNSVTAVDLDGNSTSAVAVGISPHSIAVNPLTNKVYVTNEGSNSVAEIDGADNSVAFILAGASPGAIVLNPVTNKIYAVNSAGGSVTEIDGTTRATTTIHTSGSPAGIAINLVTNKIYIAGSGSTMTVLDGATHETSTVAVGRASAALAIDPLTNRIYTTGRFEERVMVIDGDTNQSLAVEVPGKLTFAIALDPITNKIYLAHANSNSVTVIDGAANSVNTVSVGSVPSAIAVNPRSNKIYVANYGGNKVTVIDAATNSTATVTAGEGPIAIAADAMTDKVYVANYFSKSITVIDGATNSTSTIALNGYPLAIAVDPVTHRVSIAGADAANMAVIDGMTGTLAPLEPFTLSSNTPAIAVNPRTDRTYIANYGGGTVTVIDGKTNAAATVSVGANPQAIAVNPVTNKIYVANRGSNSVTVLDGLTNAPHSIEIGLLPSAIAVDTVLNKIYVTNQGSHSISVIEGATNTVTTVQTGADPVAVAVNPLTNAVYIANSGSATVSVISTRLVRSTEPFNTLIARLPGDLTTNPAPLVTFTAASRLGRNIWFQVDTWQNQWGRAAPVEPDSYSARLPELLPGPHTLYAFATDGQDTSSVQPGSPITGNISAYQFLVTPPATQLLVSAPSSVAPGVPFTITVEALDTASRFTSGYSGTMTWHSSDSAAALPKNPTLRNGFATFTATLSTAGLQTLWIRDNTDSSELGFSAIVVTPPVPCTYFLSSNSGDVSGGGAPGAVCVTAPPGCTWTAVSNTSWVRITLGASGSGNGAVTFSDTANTGSAPRSGTLTIAGQTFRVTQRLPQTIAFGPISDVPFGVAPLVINASATSLLPVVFTANTLGICSVTGSVVTILNVGVCSLTGAQPGNSFYSAATPVTQTFKIQTGLRFVAIVPCRIADTRNPAGPFGGPALAGQTSRDFVPAAGACNIPAAARAYSVNVAVVPRGPLGFLTVWPAGQAQPPVATLNSDGRVKSNAAIVSAGAGGAIRFFATNTTDVVLDINGYFVPASTSGALAFYPLTPCRIADTRSPAAYIAGQTSRTFSIRANPCHVPSTAQAYSLNFAAVPRGPLGFLTAWPSGKPRPLVATLNAITGTVTANAAIVQAGINGAVDVFATNDTDLVIDINGYFAPPATGGLTFYTLQPCRALDTRNLFGPVSQGTTAVIAGAACQVSLLAQAYVLNATVLPSTTLGYLSLWAEGSPQPLVATLNALDGAVTGNMAIVPTTNGAINIFATNASQLILDIMGYFAP